MVKSFIFIVIFCPLAIALLLPQLPWDFHKIRRVDFSEKAASPEIAATYDCNDVNFLYAQTRFNEALNIQPTTLTWKNETEIYRQIYAYMNQNVNTFLSTCAARKLFYQQLAATYSSCINRFYLLTKLQPGDNFTAAFEYPDLWYQLDFACNAGLQIAINDWYTLTSAKIHDAVENCTATFYNSTFISPDQFCSNVGVYLNCLQSHFLYVINDPQVFLFFKF